MTDVNTSTAEEILHLISMLELELIIQDQNLTFKVLMMN